MPLTPGTRVGAYEIVAALGAGGMGEVYRARDSKLKREVALKVLPADVANDRERLARFQREAEVLASLNHPHIAHVYGIEDNALVMELVEGDDLTQRIARGPIPIDEALPIAQQIAEALEAAHEQGIIHRDLKPANIKVRPDGTVKVLDFGLAKAIAGSAGSAASAGSVGLENSPTITSPAMTQAGMILGTAAYMSPEQAKGRAVDKRADIWAFGCVLYEMLTGRRAIVGDDVSDVLASVLARDVNLTALPATTPPSIRRLLRRCLEKDRVQRLGDVGGARLEIADAIAGVDVDPTGVATGARSAGRERWLWVGAVMALAMVAVWAVVARRGPIASELRFELTTPSSPSAPVAISPDGRRIAFVAIADGRSQLWQRSLESGVSTPLPGTDGAELPFWSPDSRSIGFFATDKLKRVDVDGGSVQVLANVGGGGGGGTWNQAGVILFASLGNPITSVPASGGEPTVVPRLAMQGSDFSPCFLPDGRRFLYYVRGSPTVRGVYVGQLGDPLEPRRLVDSESGAVYADTGHLLFVRQRALYAQLFDPATLQLTGDPIVVADGLTPTSGFTVSVSRTGTIAYRSSAGPAQRQFVWFDRSGKELGKVGDAVSTPMSMPMLSPDGQRVVVYRSVDGNPEIWMLELRRGAFTRFTFDAADDVFPVWSPDGTRIAFSSNRRGHHELYVKPVGGDREQLMLSLEDPVFATDWSSDGRVVLFNRRTLKQGDDVWALSLESQKTFPVVQTAFDEQASQLSPDGRWIAFQSDESGQSEIYVQPFPGPGSKWPVSTNGGYQTRWSRRGNELFYVDRSGRLMVTTVKSGSGGQSPEIGAPAPLFVPPLGGAILQGDYRHQYMLSPDAQRILVATVADGTTSPINVILNWAPR